MKNIIILTVLLLAGPRLSLAQPEVPTSVLLTFDELHPTAEDPLWEQREEIFIAAFNDREGFKKVFFTEQGQWLETRQRISRGALPQGVATFIRQHYAKADITFLAKVLRARALLYRVESELPGEIVVKELDSRGNLLLEKRINFDPQHTFDSLPLRDRAM